MKPSRLPLIVSLSVLFLLCACARPITVKDTPTVDNKPQDITLNELLQRLGNVVTLTGIAEIELKTSAHTQSGSASIVIDDAGFQLNIYSLGFLVSEFSQKDGLVYSSLSMADSDKVIFARVIRDGLVWWKLDGGIVQDYDDRIVLKTVERLIVIDKTTLRPIKQLLFLDEDNILSIKYNGTLWTDGIAYPSRIEATLGEYHLSIAFESIGFE
ncbi:MAG: hypothetical protein HQL06_12915 [Nitrospirae bacterium]|nr:hypothetical protein [Nitrospirota bacterium]